MLEKGLTPRATPKESHDIVVQNISQNLDELYKQRCFDNISLYSREKECLYDMRKTPDINPSALLQSVISGNEIGKSKPSLMAKLETAKKEAFLSAPKTSEKKSHNIDL
jgi:UDP-N-acetylglucosamine kinase